MYKRDIFSSLLSLGTQPSEAKSDEVIAPPDIKTEDEPAVMVTFFLYNIVLENIYGVY